MTRPLRSAPINRGFTTTTSRSASRTRNGTHTHAKRGLLFLTHTETRTSSTGFGLLPFHAEAANRARVASMPDTTWPISGHPPGSSGDLVDTPISMSLVSVSTRQQRFARARLPRSPPDTSHAPSSPSLIPVASQLPQHVAADNPPSPAQHRFTKPYLDRTPFHVRDTPTSRCPNSSTPCADTATPNTRPPNLSVPQPNPPWIVTQIPPNPGHAHRHGPQRCGKPVA
jgi:hypothetical protein